LCVNPCKGLLVRQAPALHEPAHTHRHGSGHRYHKVELLAEARLHKEGHVMNDDSHPIGSSAAIRRRSGRLDVGVNDRVESFSRIVVLEDDGGEGRSIQLSPYDDPVAELSCDVGERRGTGFDNLSREHVMVDEQRSKISECIGGGALAGGYSPREADAQHPATVSRAKATRNNRDKSQGPHTRWMRGPCAMGD
jgi:hypothetical protein